MLNYVSDDSWRDDFEPIFLRKEVIRKLKDVYESDLDNHKLNVLQFLTNLICWVRELSAEVAIEITEWGLLWCIYKNMYLAEDPSQFQINLCCNSIVCLSNLIYISEHIRCQILNSKLFEWIWDLFKNKCLSTSTEFTRNSIFILRNSIKYLTDKDMQYLQIFASKIEKEFFEWTNDELLENILYWYSHLFKISDEFLTSAKIVELLISKLESKSMSIRFSSLQWISQISAFKENKFDWLIKVIPYLSSLIIPNVNWFRRSVLTTTINLLAIYREEAVDIFLNSTTMLHQIFHWLGTENIKLKIELLQTLEKFIWTANLDQLHKVISEGILTHVTDRISIENNDIAIIQEYLTLVYHIFEREQALNAKSTTLAVEDFEYIGGVEIIKRFELHPNAKISEMADTPSFSRMPPA